MKVPCSNTHKDSSEQFSMSNLDSKSGRGVNINFGNLTGDTADLKNMNLNAGAVAANSLNQAADSIGSCVS
jgi:hypothetical protein